MLLCSAPLTLILTVHLQVHQIKGLVRADQLCKCRCIKHRDCVSTKPVHQTQKILLFDCVSTKPLWTSQARHWQVERRNSCTCSQASSVA